MKNIHALTAIALFALMVSSCSPGKSLSKSASRHLLGDTLLHNAHTGIAVYDPAEGKFLYTYQHDKYFVPASNTKILSCYAGMKYLGDKLAGVAY
ncbi:MAG TPA: D-alanyl-D-alanine carboxypeptidase, partial [Chitinophagaceae bacterium]|nr:D-alanyl-D-alanine carboxypeptidase [Chitinophagaceae bacterium]